MLADTATPPSSGIHTDTSPATEEAFIYGLFITFPKTQRGLIITHPGSFLCPFREDKSKKKRYLKKKKAKWE